MGLGSAVCGPQGSVRTHRLEIAAYLRQSFSEQGGGADMAPEEVAAGVMEIATANMVNGIRQVTTTRGKDPSSYALVSFGGAGGLFAPDVAEFLDVVTVISPPNPGNLSAFGFLLLYHVPSNSIELYY